MFENGRKLARETFCNFRRGFALFCDEGVAFTISDAPSFFTRPCYWITYVPLSKPNNKGSETGPTSLSSRNLRLKSQGKVSTDLRRGGILANP